VWVIELGDQGYNATFANTSSDTYLNKTLASQGEVVPYVYASATSDLANELALVTGQGPTVQTENNCPTYSAIAPGTTGKDGQVTGDGCVYPESTPSFESELTSAGDSWKAYVQGQGVSSTDTCIMPTLGAVDSHFTPASTSGYVTWRNPLVYLDDVTSSGSCNYNDTGLPRLKSDLSNPATTPNVSFIYPNSCNDGSDTPCLPGAPSGTAQSDKFLQSVVPEIMASAAYKQDGMILITFAQAPQSGAGADQSSCCVQPTQYPNLPGPNYVPSPAGTSATTGTTTSPAGTDTTAATTPAVTDPAATTTSVDPAATPGTTTTDTTGTATTSCVPTTTGTDTTATPLTTTTDTTGTATTSTGACCPTTLATTTGTGTTPTTATTASSTDTTGTDATAPAACCPATVSSPTGTDTTAVTTTTGTDTTTTTAAVICCPTTSTPAPTAADTTGTSTTTTDTTGVATTAPTDTTAATTATAPTATDTTTSATATQTAACPSADSTSSVTYGGGGQTGMLVLSRYVSPKLQDGTDYFNTFSITASLEQLFNLKYTGYAKLSGLPRFSGFFYSNPTG
jgi:hypothetical protein